MSITAMRKTTRASENQMDLLSFSRGIYSGKPSSKSKLCLCCGKTPMKQMYNSYDGVYEGNRICRNCKDSDKFKYGQEHRSYE